MTLVIAWRTTKLIEGGHRGLQAYRPICYYFYVFTFFTFFSKSKKTWLFTFLPCFIRFLELCSKELPGIISAKTLYCQKLESLGYIIVAENIGKYLHSNFRLRKTPVFRNRVHNGLQGNPRSLILAPIESAYATSYWSSIVTLVLSCPFQRYCRFSAEILSHLS